MRRAGLSSGVVALLFAAGVSAQDPMEVFNGVYLYSPSPGDRAHIKASIEQATANLGLMQRSIARGRLEDSTTPIARFQVHFASGEVLLRLDQHEYRLLLNGHPIRAKGLGGASVKASGHVTAGRLHQTLQGSRGTRYVTFSFGNDGTATMKTQIESSYFRHPVSYTLHYHKAN